MNPVVEAEALTRFYGRFPAVQDVSFTINKGQIIGLLGPNGAGKTTLMKILTAYHYPASGRARIKGYDVVEESLAAQNQVGYLPEMAPLYGDLNVSEYLNFMAEARGISKEKRKAALERALELCGLTRVSQKEISHLSKGFRQRVGLAQAIVHQPEILILDEPTSGLDPHQILEFRNLIRTIGQEKTVILSTHILQEVEALCEGVMIMNGGRILAEGPAESLARELQGETIYSLRLKTKAGINWEKTWESLSHFKSQPRLIHKESETLSRWEVVFPGKQEGGELLFDWAVQEKVKILNMSPQTVSLEDVFIQLTKEKQEVPT